MHTTFRLGDSGPEVRDVQRRLADLGHAIADVPGRFEKGTAGAVRAFQQQRGLVAGGEVDLDTWRALVEAAWKLGDRVLYLKRPMLRGDDVRDLQDRLDRIGLEVGGSDGILGPETADAILEFQLMQGLRADGQAGATTIAALARVGRDHQSVAASEVLERHRMGRRRRLDTLSAVSILIDPANSVEVPGHHNPDGIPEHVINWQLASRLHGRLAAHGARPALSRGPTNAPSSSERAELGNREDVALVVSIRANGLDSREAEGVAAYYFGTADNMSAAGRSLAERIVGTITTATGAVDCRAHPSTATLLRESRSVAVAVEVGFLTHPREGRRLAEPDYQARVVDALLDAIRDWMLDLHPAASPTGSSATPDPRETTGTATTTNSTPHAPAPAQAGPAAPDRAITEPALTDPVGS